MSEELKPCPFCGSKALTNIFLDYEDIENLPTNVIDDYEPEVTCENERCIYGWWLSPKDWNTRPIEDALTARIAALKRVIEILEDHQREVKNLLIDKNLHIDSLYEEGFKLQHRIAELELENKKLFIHNKAMFKKLMSLDSPNDTQTSTIVYGKEDSEVQQ